MSCVLADGKTFAYELGQTIGVGATGKVSAPPSLCLALHLCLPRCLPRCLAASLHLSASLSASLHLSV